MTFSTSTQLYTTSESCEKLETISCKGQAHHEVALLVTPTHQSPENELLKNFHFRCQNNQKFKGQKSEWDERIVNFCLNLAKDKTFQPPLSARNDKPYIHQNGSGAIIASSAVTKVSISFSVSPLVIVTRNSVKYITSSDKSTLPTFLPQKLNAFL